MKFTAIANKIAKWCGNYYTLETSRRKIIEYAIEVLLETVFKLIILLLLGAIFNRFFETIVFLISFCVLRFFAGGFHLKTNFGCSSVVILIWAVADLCNQYIRIPFELAVCSYVLNIFILALFAPADSKENKIVSSRDKVFNKKISIIFTSILYIWSLLLNKNSMAIIVVSITAECLSLVPYHRLRYIQYERE